MKHKYFVTVLENIFQVSVLYVHKYLYFLLLTFGGEKNTLVTFVFKNINSVYNNFLLHYVCCLKWIY